MDVIVGTAGHIDHGKTSLVKALTGIDADRLPEEKLRGITIDLGFAELDLGDVHVGFVDVPGHERFVKNMLAGASGIDVVMLVVAADEGVMPQTREHFDICRLLDTKEGLVVFTKKDLVDEATLEVVRLETAEMTRGSFLENSASVAVSSKTGEGVSELNELLRNSATRVRRKSSDAVTRLSIDRTFSVKGFGAVVTGTLVSGEISEAQEMDLLPVGRKVRVRGIQTHGKSVQRARAGQRAAVNLGGVDHEEISRGMVLAESGALLPTQIIDTELEMLSGSKSPLRSRQRVRVHIGTAEALARVSVLNESGEVAPGEKDFVQLRLESPVVAVPHERFIIRQYSPQMTIAGGLVVDNLAVKHRRRDFGDVRRALKGMMAEDDAARIQVILDTAADYGIGFSDLLARTGIRKEPLSRLVEAGAGSASLIMAEDTLIAAEGFTNLKKQILDSVDRFHVAEPLAKGMSLAALREKTLSSAAAPIFKAAMESLVRERKLEQEKDVIRIASKAVELSAPEAALRDFFSKRFRDAALEVPKFDDLMGEALAFSGLRPEHARKIFQLLIDSKELVKVSEEFYFRRDALEDLTRKLREFASDSSDRLIDVPRFKELAGLSRKYAIPLLEYFDRERITRRAGDKRLIA